MNQHENLKRELIREQPDALNEKSFGGQQNAKKKCFEVPSTSLPAETFSQPIDTKEYANMQKPHEKPKTSQPQNMCADLTSRRSRIAPVSQQIMPSHLSNRPKISVVSKPKMSQTDNNINSVMSFIRAGPLCKSRSMPDLNC